MNTIKQATHKFPVIILALAIAVATASGAYAQGKKEIIVSAASSLRNAFEKIGAVYEKQTGIKPNFNFAASGVLQQQMEAGATVDIFASAAKQQMGNIEKKVYCLMKHGKILQATPLCAYYTCRFKTEN